mgnify:CR=1 FL=1
MAIGIPSSSPAVNFREIDLTGRILSEPTNVAVIAGNFNWGPVDEPTLVTNETGLVSTFGTPNTTNTVDFHSAANFLRYSDSLYVLRGLDDSASATTAINAYASDSATAAPTDGTPVIKNSTDWDGQVDTLDNYSGDSAGDPALVRGHTILARYPGVIGNSIEVQICPADADSGGASVFDSWTYASSFDGAPGTSSYASARDGSYDEVHVIVIDKNGAITGTAGTVLEKYPYVSVASDAKTTDGSTNYVKNILNAQSNYVHFASFGSSLAFDGDTWGTSTNLGTATTKGTAKSFTDGLTVKTYTLAGGANSGALDQADFLRSYALVDDPETMNIDFIIAPGLSTSTDQASLVNNLVSIAQSERKDCVVVTSPNRGSVIGNGTVADTIVASIVANVNKMSASSYLFVDGNYLKIYDKYNDNYIWVPAASSTAGLMAASDESTAPWYSPAGTRRGQYLGLADLAYNPDKANRDTLYKVSVNPIVNLTGQGTLLYGDKTKLGRPSAFDRINVRRLFLRMEKDITRYAKDILFEFNDEFTRSEFTGVVEPYLRSIQSRRGVYAYQIVCDETNNTPEVIDNNEFIASIFVKPARSINYITLNFVAVRTGVSFEEVVGSV